MPGLNRWFKQIVIVVAVLGLLTSASPSRAQDNPPPPVLTPPLSIEERLQEPDRYLQEMVTPLLRARAAHRAAVPAFPFPAWSASPLAPTTVDDRPWSKITFASFRNNDWEIYTLNGDSTSPTRLTVRPGYDSLPKLNRGATRVAFVSDRDGNYEIYVMNVDGSAQTRLTNNAATDTWPAWSPDSSKIAFYSKRDGNYELYVMNADGTNQTRLTNNAAWDGHPEWLPDNSGIIFASNRSGAYEIWKISPDGANPQQISFGAHYASFPHYAPRFNLISFSQDANNDGWYDASSVWATGGAPMSFNPGMANWDYIAFIWSPQNSYSTFNIINYVVYQGQYYWNRAFSMASHQEEWDNYSYLLTDSDFDWWPDWQTADIASPASHVNALPAWTTTPNIPVSWTGADTGPAGLAAYDIQSRDGALGTWTDWAGNTLMTAADFQGEEGHTYYFRSRAHDLAGNIEEYPGGNGDTYTTLDTTSPATSASAPAIAAAPQFLVTWSGTDVTSGIQSYDVQYRDGALGAWTTWIISTTQTARQFNGQLGHTYYFQSRARDKAGNLEAYPGGDGDTHTTTPLYVVNGTVKGNRDQAIVLAKAQTAPAALNQPPTDHLGNFALYFNASGPLSLTAARSLFGPLPFMPNVLVSDTSSTPIIYLPPLDDLINDSHFENGDLSAWNPIGPLTPTINLTAHTGDYAVLLGGIVPSDTVSSAPYLSVIEQTITVPLMLTDGTLSLLYTINAAEPLSDSLNVYLTGATDSLTFTLPLTATDWTHQWFDVSAWTAPTATLRIELVTPDTDRAVAVLIDEVTWGSAVIGARPLYLPVMRR